MTHLLPHSMPDSKNEDVGDAKITKGYKRLLQKVSTSNDLAEELSSEQSDTKISYCLNKAEELFGALSRGKIQS